MAKCEVSFTWILLRSQLRQSSREQNESLEENDNWWTFKQTTPYGSQVNRQSDGCPPERTETHALFSALLSPTWAGGEVGPAGESRRLGKQGRFGGDNNARVSPSVEGALWVHLKRQFCDRAVRWVFLANRTLVFFAITQKNVNIFSIGLNQKYLIARPAKLV